MSNRDIPRGNAPRRLVPLLTVSTQPGYAWATTRWLRRQVAERRIPFHKVGRKVLLDLDDIDRLVDGGRVEPAEGAPWAGRRRSA